jgi:hypothetical protein
LKRILLAWVEGNVMGKQFLVGGLGEGLAPSRHLTQVIREVWRLLRQGIEMPGEPALHDELRALVAPHLPVLVHKRIKLMQALQDERWTSELNDFVGRVLWPQLAASPALGGRNANCVAELVDEIVAAEQRAETTVSIPLTSRFDTSWAS